MNQFLLNEFKNIQNQTDTTLLDSKYETLFLVSFIFLHSLGICLIVASVVRKKTNPFKNSNTNQINLLILSLQLNAIGDFILNCLLISNSHESWSSLKCNILFYACMLSMGCTLWHYVTISLNQYLIIKNPKQIRASKAVTSLSMLVPRLMPLLACVPSLFRIEWFKEERRRRSYHAVNLEKIQSVSILIVDILVPWCLITCCFTSIFLISSNTQSSVVKVNSETARRLIQIHRQSLLCFDDESTTCSTRGDSGKLRATLMETFRLKRQREISMSKRFLPFIVLFVFGYLPYGVLLVVDDLESLNFYNIFKYWFIIITSISPVVIISTNSQIYEQIKCFYEQFIRLVIANNRQLESSRQLKRVHFNTQNSQIELSKEKVSESNEEMSKFRERKRVSNTRSKSIYHKRSFRVSQSHRRTYESSKI
jgi:hypothetical protein